jgi:hypothetical protein
MISLVLIVTLAFSFRLVRVRSQHTVDQTENLTISAFPPPHNTTPAENTEGRAGGCDATAAAGTALKP